MGDCGSDPHAFGHLSGDEQIFDRVMDIKLFKRDDTVCVTSLWGIDCATHPNSDSFRHQAHGQRCPHAPALAQKTSDQPVEFHASTRMRSTHSTKREHQPHHTLAKISKAQPEIMESKMSRDDHRSKHK